MGKRRQRIKVAVDDLRVGMYVCGTDRRWLDTPIWSHQFRIRSPEDIERLQGICKFVYVDASKGPVPETATEPVEATARAPSNDVIAPGPAPQANTRRPGRRDRSSRERKAFREEMEVARPLYRRAQTVLDDLLHDARLGRSIDSDKAKDTVRGLMESVVRNPDALICLTSLKDKDKYTSMHSVNACVFALAFGRHLGLPQQKLYELGLGALLHDIGKTRIPPSILNKPGPLTGEEFEVMRRHPQLGREILASRGDLPDSAAEIAHMHHERADGMGYPRGLRGREIPLFARVVGIIDVYDAVTSERVYKQPVPAHHVLREIYSARDKAFDGRVVDKFIRCVGIYPVGTLLELNSGEIGVVVAVEHHDLTRPLVSIVRDARGAPCDPPRKLKLASLSEAGRSDPAAVRRVLDPAQLDIDVTMVCEQW